MSKESKHDEYLLEYLVSQVLSHKIFSKCLEMGVVLVLFKTSEMWCCLDISTETLLSDKPTLLNFVYVRKCVQYSNTTNSNGNQGRPDFCRTQWERLLTIHTDQRDNVLDLIMHFIKRWSEIFSSCLLWRDKSRVKQKTDVWVSVTHRYSPTFCLVLPIFDFRWEENATRR